MAKGMKTGGRQKGSPNKITAELRDMIMQALNESGGVEYLKQTAIDHPAAFLTLIGKILPLPVNVDHSSKDGSMSAVQKVTIEVIGASTPTGD